MEEVSSSSQSVELLEHNEGNIENESEKTSNVKEKVEDPKFLGASLHRGMEEVSSSSQSVELLEHNEGNIENESEKTSNVEERVEDPKKPRLKSSLGEQVELEQAQCCRCFYAEDSVHILFAAPKPGRRVFVATNTKPVDRIQKAAMSNELIAINPFKQDYSLCAPSLEKGKTIVFTTFLVCSCMVTNWNIARKAYDFRCLYAQEPRGQKDDLHAQLWHACAGPLVNVPRAGDKVFYFPQGHIEQVEAYSNQDGKVEMPIYDLPSKILCKVVYVQLKAEPYTDEVFAQITLLPEGPSPEHRTSQCLHQKINACPFRKRLTPSDQSAHGGFSVPKRYADECFPPLDMSQEPPTQELVAKDLHGSEWRFRHIYRGHPKRHLLSSGWSTFVSAKKLVVGDACIFLRGENGELYVGVRRATKSQISIPASVISGVSMQHGILASAFHAVSTGTMFTVYYRPCQLKMTIQLEQDSACSLMVKNVLNKSAPWTVVGINNIDCIRWPGSEWRCLKVQWDAPSKKIVRPQRISHWNIEPEEVKKKCSSILALI
ncbi:hypothetical protein TEA_027122 [Camellia sinensis var. sinensis]|uniref:Auxin response factor n=1 Tax=Camellia sinensis var. sinensis TaxID=542762 RepID=A0A4S4DX98_CAMSN|nr:hypothetical protein TEA_027122 [Camellia sinensis var. sinensis]